MNDIDIMRVNYIYRIKGSDQEKERNVLFEKLDNEEEALENRIIPKRKN